MYSLFYIFACKIFIFLVYFVQVYIFSNGSLRPGKDGEILHEFSMLVHGVWLVHEVVPLVFVF